MDFTFVKPGAAAEMKETAAPQREEFHRRQFSDKLVAELCAERGIAMEKFAKLWDREQVRLYREFVRRSALLPDYDNVENHSPDFHEFNIWEHSMLAYTYAIIAAIEGADDVREAALLHDVGKYFHFQLCGEETYTFHGHGAYGANVLMFQRDWNFPWSTEPQTRFLVAHHECPNLRKSTIAKVATRSLGTGTDKFRQLVLIGLLDWAAKGRTPIQDAQKRELSRVTKEMALLTELPESLVDYLISK